ncbi:hypothetical protein MUP95_08910 [bacterium]|nr:hypothetical protein [bacterium]
MKKTFASTHLGIILLLLFFFFQFHPALAQNELSDSQIQERLQVIHQVLEQGKSNANRWWYGWLIGYSAATIGQGAILLTSEDKETRQDMALGAATTFLGAIGQILTPRVPGTAPDRLADISESTPEEKSNQLLEAEKLLQENALREKDGRSWKTHAITGVVNLSSGLIVWLGFKRSIWEGVGNFVLNTVITEVQIWTQPMRAVTDYDDYIKKYKSGEKLGCRKSDTSWSITISPEGLGISILF